MPSSPGRVAGCESLGTVGLRSFPSDSHPATRPGEDGMIKFWMHASERNLKRFADGELPPKTRERVAAHLAQCVECRGYVAFVHELRARVVALESTAAAPGLLDRITARLAAGDSVILPTADPRPAPLAWRVPAAIAACLLALAAVWIVWPTP